MSAGLWILLLLVLVCAAGFVYELWRDRRLAELQAQLDEAAGRYHSPADRLKALEDRVRDVERELLGETSSSERHANTDAQATGLIPIQ